MKLKTIISLFACSCFFGKSEAQQIFSITQYMEHNFLYNPAAAGAGDHPSIGASYKKMWSGIDGGPQTTILFGDKYFSKKKIGVGIVLYDDKTGPTSREGGEINLSYSIPLKGEKRLMFGLGGQFLQYKINKADFAKYIPNDPLYLTGPGSEFKGDASAGIYYKSSTLNAGVSVKQLIQSKLDFIKGNTNPTGRLYRHYYLMADYRIKVDEDNMLIPNVLVNYQPNAPADVEAGMRLEYKDLIWIGFNYHYQQSYSAFAGLKINHKIAIGYAYQQFQTPLSVFDSGGSANEILLRYFF